MKRKYELGSFRPLLPCIFGAHIDNDITKELSWKFYQKRQMKCDDDNFWLSSLVTSLAVSVGDMH